MNIDMDHSCGCSCCHEHHEQSGHELKILLFCAALFVMGLMLENNVFSALSKLNSFAELFFVVPYLICGYPVLKSGLSGIRHKDIFNEFTLMGLTTLIAIGLGEYGEAVGVMLFYRIGEYVQDKATQKSRSSLNALLTSKPRIAHVYQDDNLVDVLPEQVSPGSKILVRAGEKIPLDGVVLEGSCSVDQSPLTGEHIPVLKQINDSVFAGSIVQNGALTIKVTSSYADSSVAKILDMVENAIGRKAKTERFITRFARIYTPIVIVLAVLVACLPPLLGAGTWHDWIYRALVLLVVSCPCALLISIPLGYFGGIGAASRLGILVKGGNVFDSLKHVSGVVFDKTGTLTKGAFQVQDIFPAPDFMPEKNLEEQKQELLLLAASLEKYSNHPLAHSIVRQVEASKLIELTEVKETPGQGLAGKLNHNCTLLAGSLALLRTYNIEIPESFEIKEQGSLVHLAKRDAETQYLGYIYLADAVKSDSLSTVTSLRDMGLPVWMLTGDSEESAAKVAKELNLTGYRSELLPEQKVSALHQIADGKLLAFVGDGINDAPVLVNSHVGVAMGKLGNEALIELADVVIINDSPSRVQALFTLAKKVRTIVWQNIGLALGVKIAIMCFGIAGLSSLWEAVFADVGVALLAVLNATRAGKVEFIETKSDDNSELKPTTIFLLR